MFTVCKQQDFNEVDDSVKGAHACISCENKNHTKTQTNYYIGHVFYV